jgi:predicted dinucleotide-binding enzyme
VPLAGDDKERWPWRAPRDRRRFEPVIVGPLAAGKSFDSSQPIFLKAMTARELRAALKLP